MRCTLLATSWVVAAIWLTAAATCSVSTRWRSRPEELLWARVSDWRACSLRCSAVSCRRVRQVFIRASWLSMAISRRACTPRLSVYICAISGSEVVCSARRSRRLSPRCCQLRPSRPSGTERPAARAKPQECPSQLPIKKPIWLTRMNGSQSCTTGSHLSRCGIAGLPWLIRWYKASARRTCSALGLTRTDSKPTTWFFSNTGVT
ncbi:hypothetical protein D3C85_1217090 [compost metagenome]